MVSGCSKEAKETISGDVFLLAEAAKRLGVEVEESDDSEPSEVEDEEDATVRHPEERPA